MANYQVALDESKNWNYGKTYQLQKGNIVNIPTQIKNMTIGLGWDSKHDLDASLILLDEDCNHIETVYYNHALFKNDDKERCVRHYGDTLDG